jgi:hypothetical protein
MRVASVGAAKWTTRRAVLLFVASRSAPSAAQVLVGVSPGLAWAACATIAASTDAWRVRRRGRLGARTAQYEDGRSLAEHRHHLRFVSALGPRDSLARSDRAARLFRVDASLAITVVLSGRSHGVASLPLSREENFKLMSNTVAIWGAVTGTIGTLTGAGNLLRTVRRDRADQKRELEVTHGWQYAYGHDDELLDVWVCVTLYNTGRRPLHVQYVGFEAMVIGDRRLAEGAGVDLAPDNNVWVNQRFEIALNGETIEVAPDGPWVRVWTRLVPMCRYGIDPTTTDVVAYAVAYHERYWWEATPQPLLARPSQIHRTAEDVGEAVAQLVVREMGDDKSEPVRVIAGHVVGLQRLILDGDVLHTRELFPTERFRAPDDDVDDADS